MTKLADNSTLLTRRAAIKNAVALVGGVLTATQLSLLNEAVAANVEDAPPRLTTTGDTSN